ncbi:hypothetical protein PDJAM_G00169080 [Pangasius djambal]|uniref:Uncharacterized protein n=1 Tax=Pangasius djambal TaxID=1691987 RepID=A0ACC5ZMT0_9TELE|nr:hypothetical protein [Pangasius djambal]
MITVDCLFHEDQGLLPCHKNYKALDHIKKWRKPESRAIFGGHKDQKTPKQMTVQEQENPKALITQRTQSMEGLPPKSKLLMDYNL